MNIGFVGVGTMGGPMATNLLKAGHTVTVHDARPAAAEKLAKEHGARFAATIADACKGNSVVFTSLPGPADVEKVTLSPGGILECIEPGSVYIDLSTNAPSMVRKIHAEFAKKGIPMMDGPVSGGEEGAIAGTLSVMLGGEEPVFQKVEPVLKGIGTNLFYCGAIGSGSVTKLANNLSSVIAGIGLSETLTMGVKAGVDLSVLARVIGASTGSSSRLIRKFPRYLFQGNFTPGFAVNLSAKDTRLALELAEELGVPMAVGQLAKKELDEAIARGWGTQDSDAIMKLQEERAGVQLRLIE